jgi:hypothetical protein
MQRSPILAEQPKIETVGVGCFADKISAGTQMIEYRPHGLDGVQNMLDDVPHSYEIKRRVGKSRIGQLAWANIQAARLCLPYRSRIKFHAAEFPVAELAQALKR